MQCKYCDKPTVHNCSVCAIHGGHRIRYNEEAPNYKHGEYSQRANESREKLRALSDIGNYIGMFNRKIVGRRPKNPLIDNLERFKKLFGHN